MKRSNKVIREMLRASGASEEEIDWAIEVKKYGLEGRPKGKGVEACKDVSLYRSGYRVNEKDYEILSKLAEHKALVVETDCYRSAKAGQRRLRSILNSKGVGDDIVISNHYKDNKLFIWSLSYNGFRRMLLPVIQEACERCVINYVGISPKNLDVLSIKDVKVTKEMMGEGIRKKNAPIPIWNHKTQQAEMPKELLPKTLSPSFIEEVMNINTSNELKRKAIEREMVDLGYGEQEIQIELDKLFNRTDAQ